MTCLASGDFAPRPQSFLPVGIGGRRHQCLILATPSVSYTGDALPWRRHVLAMPGAVNLFTLALALTLALTLVNV